MDRGDPQRHLEMKPFALPPFIGRLFRSAVAGGLATLVDLGVLTGLVALAGLTPRAASITALVAGGVAAFVTQKRYAFRAPGGRIVRQAVQFAVVQIGSTILTGLLFDLVLRFLPRLSASYVIVRLVTSNLVWLGFSFPLWHFVFRSSPAEMKRSEARGPP
jgi:putative flippase GtrA